MEKLDFDTISVREGSLKLKVPDPSKYNLDSKMPVFYNPVMVKNRDVSVLLLKSLNFRNRALDLLAASGVRGLRIANETSAEKVVLNDVNLQAVELMIENAHLNKVGNIEIIKRSARELLAEKEKYDYIDIDPFGTPIGFLDFISKLRLGGVIGVTATDTSALCGTYPKACLRKYNSLSLRNEFMYETGLRILTNKVRQAGLKMGRTLRPIYAHSSNHYMRVYLKDSKKSKLDDIGHIYYCPKCLDRFSSKQKLEKKCCGKRMEVAGKLWLGSLFDRALAKKMFSAISESGSYAINSTKELVKQIYLESEVKEPWFFDIHKIAKIYRVKIPKFDLILEALRERKFKAFRTHYSKTGIKTDADILDIVDIIENLKA